MDLRQTYNRIARDWHRDHKADSWWQTGTDKFISLLPKDAQILDAGCGGGTKSKYLVERGLKVTGIDFSEELIAIAKENVPGADFRVLDLRQAETLHHVFDGIFLQAVLLHFPKHEAPGVLSGLIKSLRSGGLLYIAVKGQYPGGVAEEEKTEEDYGYPYKRFFSYYTRDEIHSYLHQLGCRVVWYQEEAVGKTNWLQIIGRKL